MRDVQINPCRWIIAIHGPGLVVEWNYAAPKLQSLKQPMNQTSIINDLILIPSIHTRGPVTCSYPLSQPQK